MSKTTIKELRAANKLTQAAFAQAIGVSAASVAAYEAGRTGPSEKVVARIRELYGADLEIEKAEKPAKESAKKPAAKKPAKKAAAKKTAEKAEAVVEEPASQKAEKPARKPAAKKPAAKKAAAKKPAAKKAAAPATEFVIQSPMGGSITPEEILAKVGPADRIYVRVDENKAYWVRGEETGSVDLW